MSFTPHLRIEAAVRLRVMDRPGSTTRRLAVEHLERVVNLGQTWIEPEDADELTRLAGELDIRLSAATFTAPCGTGVGVFLQVWVTGSRTPPPLPMAVMTETQAKRLDESVGAVADKPRSLRAAR